MKLIHVNAINRKETWYDRQSVRAAPSIPALPPALEPIEGVYRTNDLQSAANDPANAKKTVAIVPPVMMSPPSHWSLPKYPRQMGVDRNTAEQTGVYHKWKMPLLSGAIHARSSIKQVLNPHHLPHLSCIRAAISLPGLSSYNNSKPTFQKNVSRNVCPPENQSHLSSQMMLNSIPFREPSPIRPQLQPPYELQSSRPMQEKPVSNHLKSVIVTAPQTSANSPRSDLLPPTNNPPIQCNSNLLQPSKTTARQPGFHQNRIPELIAINDSVMPPLIWNQLIPKMALPALPAPLANLG